MATAEASEASADSVYSSFMGLAAFHQEVAKTFRDDMTETTHGAAYKVQAYSRHLVANHLGKDDSDYRRVAAAVRMVLVKSLDGARKKLDKVAGGTGSEGASWKAGLPAEDENISWTDPAMKRACQLMQQAYEDAIKRRFDTVKEALVVRGVRA